MIRHLITVAVFLLQCLAAFAVDVQPLAKRDQPIVITHEEGATINAIFGRVVEGRVSWVFLPDAHFVRQPKQTVMSGPPGEYIITSGDSKLIKIAEEGKPDPKPKPEPSPNPQPDPSPDPGPSPQPEPDPDPNDDRIKTSKVVWLEESSDRGKYPSESDTMRSAELWQWLAAKQITVSIYDDDQEKASEWVTRSKGKRPAFWLVSDDGKRLLFDAPKTVAAAVAIVEKYTK